MNRRKFLGMMVGGLAAGAAVRTWPFRVYSFPSELKRSQLLYAGESFSIDLKDIVPLEAGGINVDREVFRVVSFEKGVLIVERGAHARLYDVSVQ